MNINVFSLRRAIERLRDGLFDSIAVDHLTIEDEEVKQHFFKGLQALEQGESETLCICGSYGQGKSHTLTYLHRHALSLGYATSFVQLDLREVSFHQFSVVFRALMEKLSLPGGEAFATAWRRWGVKHSLQILDEMPHRFRMILIAMLCEEAPTLKTRKKAPNGDFSDFSFWLEKAFMGHDLRLSHLRTILKARNVEGYRKEPLTCRGNLLYVQMVQSLGKVLKEMGYKGLVVFFDEAESITQGRVKNRAKSYEILDLFFQNRGFLYPLFACTNDFFDQIKREQYDDEKRPFPKNYAEAWNEVHIVRLQESPSSRWETLQNRLIQLYAEAYSIDISAQRSQIKESLQRVFEKLQTQEPRCKLKALVNQLDIETQFL